LPLTARVRRTKLREKTSDQVANERQNDSGITRRKRKKGRTPKEGGDPWRENACITWNGGLMEKKLRARLVSAKRQTTLQKGVETLERIPELGRKKELRKES